MPELHAIGSPAAFVPAPDTDAHADTTRTILCVDDEPNVLAALVRLLRGTGHRVLTASGGPDALALMAREQVDLLISDMRMPGMSGTDLMLKVRSGWPHVTRLLLTGHSDVSATIAAINEGQVHRYLTKPWGDAELVLTIKESFEHKFLEEEKQRLEALTRSQNEELKHLNTHLEALVADRTQELEQANERVKKNYFNSIKTFSNLIELRGGQLMGHARRVADLSLRTAKVLGLNESQTNDVLIAALLHDIGQIGLPDALLNKAASELTPREAAPYRMHPVFGEQALLGQDDMQNVAAVIRAHHERFDGQGYPDGLAGNDIPLEARILAVADAYEDLVNGRLVSEHMKPADACALLFRGRGSQFDPEVLDAFMSLFAHLANNHDTPAQTTSEAQAVLLRPDELQAGMIMARDLLSPQGVLLLASEHVLTTDLIKRIRVFERRNGRPILLATRPAKEAP
ncbi:MAG: response regulator [Aquabacterium sp.]|nr:response regulator [Aquabacterium sp.]